MRIKVIKEDQITIGYIGNVTEIIELPNGRARIIGSKKCYECGHVEVVQHDTEESDMIVMEPTLD